MRSLKTPIGSNRGALHLLVFLTLAIGIVSGAWRISFESKKVIGAVRHLPAEPNDLIGGGQSGEPVMLALIHESEAFAQWARTS